MGSSNILKMSGVSVKIKCIITVIVTIITMFLFNSSIIKAVGGDSGYGTSCSYGSSGYCQAFGAAWARYKINSGGPNGGFRNGTTYWSDIKSKCGNYTDEVYVFVVNYGYDYPKKPDRSRQQSYNYWDGAQKNQFLSAQNPYIGGNIDPYKIELVPNYIDTRTAVSAYNTMSDSGQQGVKGTFGKDIGWFCAPPSINWSIHLQNHIFVNGKDTKWGDWGNTTNWSSVKNRGGTTADAKATVGDTTHWQFGACNPKQSGYTKNTKTNKRVDIRAWQGSTPTGRVLPDSGSSWQATPTLFSLPTGTTPGSKCLWKDNINKRTWTQNDVDKTFCVAPEGNPINHKNQKGYGKNNLCVAVKQDTSGKTKDICNPNTRATRTIAREAAIPNGWVEYHGEMERRSKCRGGDDDIPPPNRGLTPLTKVDKTIAQSGDKITFNYSINNPDGPTHAKNVGYESQVFVLKKEFRNNAAFNKAKSRYIFGTSSSDFDAAACNRRLPFQSTSYCENGLSGRNANITVNYPGVTNLSNRTVTVDANANWSTSPGDLVCSYLTINNWNIKLGESSRDVRSSNIACVEVIKSPQLQINGADSFARKGFTGAAFSSANQNNRNRGSWSQYGLIARYGPISNFGSAGYNLFNSASINNATKANKLWFANKNLSSPGYFGMGHNFAEGLPKVDQILNNVNRYRASNYRANSLDLSTLISTINHNNTTASSTANIENANTITKYYEPSSRTFTLSNESNQSIPPGARIMLYVKGNVTITQNIVYPNFFRKLQDIPNFIIYATGNINIAHNVTRLDGVFISQNGAINTCAIGNNAAATNSSSNRNLGEAGNCQNQLIINGALLSKNSPTFQRTYGATKENPALVSEKLKYQPNLYLLPNHTANDRSAGDTMWTTVSETILPARW